MTKLVQHAIEGRVAICWTVPMWRLAKNRISIAKRSSQEDSTSVKAGVSARLVLQF